MARVILCILLLAVPACSRGVSVGTPPTAVYAIAVTNGTADELIVTYDDGAGPRALGAVAAGATDRFVIAAPARTTIRVTGRNAAGTRTATAASVELTAGQTTPLVLRY